MIRPGAATCYFSNRPCSLGISLSLDDLIESVLVVINGKPKPVLSASDQNRKASGAGAFHPHALSEPAVILSHHRAPIVRPYP